MQVSLTATGGLERRLEVAVPAARVASEVEQRLKRISRTARLKGFRPGKAPFTVIRRQFGEQVHAEVINELMRSTYADALNQEKLTPAAGPRIEPIAMDPGSDLKYAAIFEVLPEVRVRPSGEMTIERPVATVGEADIDAMIESMRRQRPIFTAVERPARATDRVIIDYEGRIDGAAVKAARGEDVAFIIGSHRVMAELEGAVQGAGAGETRTVTVNFPKEHQDAQLAGQAVEVQLAIKKVEEQSLPVVDEEFMNAFGVAEGGVERLRTEVRASMERELEGAIRSRVRDQMFDALYRDNPLEVPQSMVEQQIQAMQQQMMRRTGTQDPAQLPGREAFQASASRRVALGLLIGEIVRAQNLKVDRARVEERLESITATHPDPQEARRQYLASREAMEQLESTALEDQALDWLVSQVKVVEQPSNFRALTGFGQTA